MMRLFALPLLALALAQAAPLVAQEHDHSVMDYGQAAPDHEAPPAAHDHLGREQEPSGDAPRDHSDHSPMDHSTGDPGESDHSRMVHGDHENRALDLSQTDHSAMDHPAMGHDMASQPAEMGPPPRAFEGPRHAADETYGADVMAPARRQLARENGQMRTGQVFVERLEARLGEEDGYLWDVQAFYGGDLDRFAVKSEGEGAFGGAVEDAELQALWSHAIGPYFDLQAGARYDFEPDSRVHAVLGVQGLAPYMIHVDAAAFLSDKGDLTARIEAEYDQRITQQLILQPRVEFNLAAQDIAERDIAAGPTSLEAGLRLRYEIVPELAPYVGISFERLLGDTADITRAEGEDPSVGKVLVGLRAWF